MLTLFTDASASRAEEWVQFLFGGDFPESRISLLHVVTRAALVYVMGLALVRLGKSRLIGRVTSLDVLLGFILGSLLSRGITGQASLSGTFFSSAALVGLHWLLTWISCISQGFGKLVKGHANLIVEEGRVIEPQLRKSHLSHEDLQEELRLQGVSDVAQVRWAYKERNGEVSVIRKSSH